MLLRPRTKYALPVETARLAQACFPHGHPSLLLPDEPGVLCCAPDCAARCPTRGQPAAVPGWLALVTLLQCAERLPDRQAADAVRSRIDWQYRLGLERTDPGLDHTIRSAFRGCLVEHEAMSRLFALLLERLKA